MNAARRVLVCDDELQILRALKVVLRDAGFEVAAVATAKEALDAAAVRPPDAAIIDLMLPDGSGVDLCRRLREWTSMPIIVLSAVGEEAAKVEALEAGADDYVTKPFGRQELLARVESLLRRAPTPEVRDAYRDRLLEVDFSQRRVRAGDEQIELTPLEFRLLTAFVDNPGQLLAHDQLLELAWGGDRGTSRDQVKLYVGYLRRKLAAAGVPPAAIETVRGFGYRYSPN